MPNPIPSTDVADFLENVKDFDSLCNLTAGSYVDRMGAARLSVAEFFKRNGYEVPVAFASGISVSRTTQTVIYNGNTYAALATAVPFTTTGTFNGAQWALLAQNLEPQGLTKANVLITSFVSTGIADGAWIHFAGRSAIGDGGGGYFRYSASSTQTADGGLVFAPTGGGRLLREGWTVLGFNGQINVKWFGAKGDGDQTTAAGTDDTAAFNAAIAAMGGTHDLASAYIYQPANTLYIPRGVYILSSTLSLTRNNLILDGDGTFNTVLMCARTVQISSLVRFQGAYSCQINQMTIDGGLPFTPTATETYGADVGLVLDQCAHFSSVGLNICNTRYEGKRCIHLWESYFEDLRIFNVGFFGNGSNRSAGIRFTQVGKLDNTFPGGESNNVIYNKVAFGTVGSHVSADEVPTYNITFNNVIAEGRTWGTQYGSVGETKWRVGATASNFVIEGGYSYPHAQSYNANATLFDFSNAGPGCRVRNYRVYAELNSTYQEISRILSCDSNFLMELDVSVEEVGSNTIQLMNSSSISTVTGSWEYRTSLTRARASLFNSTSESRFVGTLLLRDSAGVNNYQYQPKTTRLKTVGTQTSLRPIYDCVAAAKVDGRSTGGALLLQGLTYSRNSTGIYSFSFVDAMPDADYVVNVSANILNSASEKPEIASQTNTGFTIANRAGATYYDPSILNVAVFR